MENEIAAAAHHDAGIMSPDVTMIVLTWVAFISLLIILHKFAWKPIFALLDAREEKIRKAVEDAEKAKETLAHIEQTREQILTEAHRKAKDIVDQSQKAAVEAAKVIQQKTREEAQIVFENARREIKEEAERAQAALREESAKVAIILAGKLLEENLDDDKNRKLVNELIKKI